MFSISLRKSKEIPMKRQLYQAIREQILNGMLQAGEPLPSTRELAAQLKMSRNTVNEAYDMLITEGFVRSSQGAPTRVANGLFMNAENPPMQQEFSQKTKPELSADFQTGRPDLRQFPQYLWQQILHKTSEELSISQFGYSGPQGLPELRVEISAWLFRSKGISVDFNEIFITSGATHAIHIIAGLLARNGNRVAIEDPCNRGILQTFCDAGCNLLPIPVDERGILPEFIKNETGVGMVYVTPSHQFPLGGILPAGRRAELIRYAREKNIYLMEDDYDSEFRYIGDPIAPLYAMDSQRVIYIGTFSKVLFPAIRVGYIILPRELRRKWCELRTHTDVQNAPFEQAALATFLRTRKFDRHIKKMRKLYGIRRSVLLEALKSSFGDTWRVFGDSAGLHLAIQFPGMCFGEAFLKRCSDAGIRISTVEQHSIRKGSHLDMLLLGYGHMEPEEIQRSISKLYALIQDVDNFA
jgi:GntR family transcriptional regulator / MocR family aminotransferase